LSYGDASGGNRAIATYRIQQNGTLTLVTNSEKLTTFTGINDLWFDPTGNWLAVVGFNGLQIFHLLANGQLASGPHVLTGTRLFGVRWDSRGHVIANNTSALYIYNFSNGALKAASGSPHATSTLSTSGLAVLPVTP
jgi:hypothetical protein